MEYKSYLFIIGTLITVISIFMFYIVFTFFTVPKANWPPQSSDCPDYWIKKKDSTGEYRCYDILGMTPLAEVDGTTYAGTGGVRVYQPYSDGDGSAGTGEWGGLSVDTGEPETIPTTHNGADAVAGSFYRRAVNGESVLIGSDTKIIHETGETTWETECGKQGWALENGISWDGITNLNLDCN
jgi:hypothetical protein